MKIEKMKAARKRGADMTQALLYAAFAIVVLISVLAMYQVVTLNSNKTVASRTVSTAAQEARTLYRNSADFTGLNNATLIQAGAVPTDAIKTETTGTGAGATTTQTISVPYQGTVVFASAAGGKFQATVTLDNTRGGRALCTFLTSGKADEVITGPMGAEYTVPATAKAGCATAAPFTVVYER